MCLPYALNNQKGDYALLYIKKSLPEYVSVPTQLLMKSLIEIEDQRSKIKVLGKEYSLQTHHPSLDPIIKKIYPSTEMKQSPEVLLNELDEMKRLLQKDSMLTKESFFQFLKVVLSRNGFLLQYVPDQYKTVELCLLAIINNPWALEYVPSFLKKYKICLLAVSAYGCLLQFVPEKYKDVSLCWGAVLQDPLALQYVKDAIKIQNRDLCRRAIAKDGLAIQYIPKHWKIDHPAYYLELCHRAVTNEPRALQYMDDSWKALHPDLCRVALLKNGWVLAHVPHWIQKHYLDLCELAVKNIGLALSYVCPPLREYEICEAAILQNPLALEYVPTEIKMKYPELCLRAFTKNKWVFQYFSKECRTYECSLEAVMVHGTLLRYVPEELKEYFLCAAAIVEDPRSIEYVPHQLLRRRPDLCQIAVSGDGWMIDYIPEDLKSRWICLEALLSTVRNSLSKLDGFFPSYEDLDESFLDSVPSGLKEEFTVYYEEVVARGVNQFYTEKGSLRFPKFD